MYKKILLLAIIITLFIGVSYMNNKNYKISEDINSKYLYITINNIDTKILEVSNGDTNKIAINRDDMLKLSLLENAIIAVKWKIKYDTNYILQTDSKTIDVKPLFKIKREGEDFTRREIFLKGLKKGKTKIECEYGDFNFFLDVTIF